MDGKGKRAPHIVNPVNDYSYKPFGRPFESPSLLIASQPQSIQGVSQESGDSKPEGAKFWFENVITPGYFSPVLCPGVQMLNGERELAQIRPEVLRPPSNTCFLGCEKETTNFTNRH